MHYLSRAYSLNRKNPVYLSGELEGIKPLEPRGEFDRGGR